MRYNLALKTIVLALLFPLLSSAKDVAETPSLAPATLDEMNVVWNTPSTDAGGSMPLGNGEVVSNVWVEQGSGDLMLLIARTDTLSEVCRFLKLGRVRIHFDGAPLLKEKFEQKTVLREGVISISGGGLNLCVFVDAQAHVLHVVGESTQPLLVSATMENWRGSDTIIASDDKSVRTVWAAPFELKESADMFLPAEKQSVSWYHRNEASVVSKVLENQSLLGAKGAFDPLLHRTFGARFTGTGLVSTDDKTLKSTAAQNKFDMRLTTYCAQTNTLKEWCEALLKEDGKSTDAASALARTQKWWAQYWGRSWVFIEKSDSIPDNTFPLRIGVDSNNQNLFPGEIHATQALAGVWNAKQVESAFLKGHKNGVAKDKVPFPKIENGLTLSAWINPSTLGVGRIFDKVTAGSSDGFLFDLQGASLRLIVGNKVCSSGNVMAANEWQHVVATLTPARDCVIYVNGKKVAESANTDTANVLSRGYVLQRYAMGLQGRGAYPIKFNGGFFCVETGGTTPDWRLWGDCYWYQNTRHMYHPMLACGDFDLMEPFFNFYEKAAPLAQSRVEKFYAAQGISFPETITPFGTHGGDYGWDRKNKKPADDDCWYTRHIWGQGAELVALMLDKWDYTHDEVFLKQQVLPMAEGVLRYFDTRFKRDANGKLIIDPTQSIETYWYGVINDMPVIAGISNISRRLCALNARLLTPTQQQLFAHMRDACPPLPVEMEAGRRELAPAEKYSGSRSNCENPELYAVWPFREVCLARPALLAEGKSAYEHRGAQLPCGWGYDGSCAALLGLTQESANILALQAANSNPYLRWPASWGPNYDWMPDQNHGGNLMEHTQLMLLQGESGGKILLLPAWPPKWNVHFKLHAPDQTTVECVLKDGKITLLKVLPASRLKDVVKPVWAK